MILAWWRRRRAAALMRAEGFYEIVVDPADGSVRGHRDWSASKSVDLTAPTIHVEHRNGRWRLYINAVGGVPRLLHPSASTIDDARAREALTAVIRHAPLEIEVVGGALSASFMEPPARWGGVQEALVNLGSALRPLRTNASLSCPACLETPLISRAGLGTCATCKGRLVTGDLARERIFDPRGLEPGALKDAGVGKGLVERCPACAHPMAPVLIDTIVVDVCRGCGALWCDEGELATLTPAGFA